MATPNVLVLTGYGINCEEETKYAFELVGAKAEVVHINDLIEKRKALDNYQIMAFPGGFSYGDDTGSGNALANKLRNNISDKILKFIEKKNLVIGICNGFQVLVNLGLLPAIEKKYNERQVALTHNIKAIYECRWVDLHNVSSKCLFTKGIEFIHLPVAHGEGNFYSDENTLKRIKERDLIVLKYVRPDGSPANREYPINPNGSIEDIAGICDETGRIFGLMPHPERYLSFHNREDWTLIKEVSKRQNKKINEEGEGVKIFRNAVEYFG